MRFGVLHMSRPASGRAFLDEVRRVEDAGFDSLLLSDHTERSPLAPIPALAAAAAVTSRLTLGSLVLCNDFRHPAILAKEALTLHLLAPGRIELGLGAGWMVQDYEQAGIRLDPPGRRIERLAETLDILASQLAGETTTRRGRHYAVSAMPAVPAPPAGSGRPRLLVGGAGRRVLALAARRADIVSLNWNLRAGRVGTAALLSGTRAATEEKLAVVGAAAPERAGHIELHVQCYFLELTDRPLDAVARFAASRGADVDPKLLLDSPHVLAGSPAELAERLAEQRESLGISYVSFYDEDAAKAAAVLARLA